MEKKIEWLEEPKRVIRIHPAPVNGRREPIRVNVVTGRQYSHASVKVRGVTYTCRARKWHRAMLSALVKAYTPQWAISWRRYKEARIG